MKPSKSTYKLGESVYDAESNEFIGYFVNNLTDDIHGQNKDYLDVWKQYGPIGEYDIGPNTLPLKCYSKRKVFCFEFGSVNQLLVQSVDGELTWINV